MELLTKKSILIIAPSLIAESLSLKLTSLNNNLDILLNANPEDSAPDLIIWNILNYQSEDLLRIELLKLKERWLDAKILIIFSGDFINDAKEKPYFNSEGLLLNPSVEKVLESIKVISDGGRVFDLENNNLNVKKEKELTFNQKLLSSGLKQIDREINYIFKYLNEDSTSDFYKFILKGRLRELITAKSFLIFLWGNTLDIYSEGIYPESSIDNQESTLSTIFIKNKSSLEVWDIILDRLVKRYSETILEEDFNNSSIILSGLKKEYVSRLICKMLNELDNLIKNINENYKEKDY